MFSRLKELTSQKPRQLITSCMFGAYIVLATANVIVHRDALTALDLGILVPAIATLGTAVTHSIVRSIHNVLIDDDNEPENSEEAKPDTTLCVRNSSHNIINSALHITSSSCFITFDALLLAGITTIPVITPHGAVVARITGSGMWCSAAWLNLFTAIARDRNNENQPDTNHDPLGIKPEAFNLTNEILYISAALCYAYAIYTESTINPYRAAANSLWLLAGAIGTSAAIYDCVKSKSDEPTEQKESNNNDTVIELSELTESSSSDVVIESPGMGM